MEGTKFALVLCGKSLVSLMPDLASKSHAAIGSLKHVAAASLSINRIQRGHGFVYRQRDQRLVRKPPDLKRIKSLAIPPAWTNVRICARANGHLQATGRDARGRKQYIYHPQWRKFRDRKKFVHMIAFAHALPSIRKRVRRDLKRKGVPKSKVLAAVVRLLERSRIRVGNETYTKNNGSYGLTTFRDRHVRVQKQKLSFQFRGKSGKDRSVEFTDAELARVVKRCQEIPGQELFQYIDDEGQRQKINSDDVNNYLRDISGGDFTAKDFRTWSGTLMMSKLLDSLHGFDSKSQAKKQISEAIKAVAKHLGNTPSICRKCYVHPAVIEAYLSGKIHKPNNGKRRTQKSNRLVALRSDEMAVLRLLTRHHGCHRDPRRKGALGKVRKRPSKSK